MTTNPGAWDFLQRQIPPIPTDSEQKDDADPKERTGPLSIASALTQINRAFDDMFQWGILRNKGHAQLQRISAELPTADNTFDLAAARLFRLP